MEFSDILLLINNLKNRYQFRQQIPLGQEDRHHPLMPLLFGDGLKLGQEIGKVVGGGVGHLVLEVEEDALGRGDGDGVLALVLLDQLPEGGGAVVVLEADGHDLVLLDLRPLDPIYQA